MSKKQFEHIDNKFREAAENFQPPQHEEAWLKMEKLLQKDDRKPHAGGFWMTTMLLVATISIGGSILFLALKNKRADQVKEKASIYSTQRRDKIKPDSKSFLQSKDNGSSPTSVAEGKKVAAINMNEEMSRRDGKPIVINEKRIGSLKSVASTTIIRTKRITEEKDGLEVVKHSIFAGETAVGDKESLASKRSNAYEQSKSKPTGSNGDKNTDVNAIINGDVQPTTPATPDVLVNTTDKKQKDSAVIITQKSVNKKAIVQETISSLIIARELEQQKKINHFLSGFYFTASISSDGNAVQGSSIKNVTAMYGIGIGYQVNKRFSVQTGLYAGSKKYKTDSSGYYHKPGYWRMVKIKSINADCFIYNVPLSIRYNLTLGRQGNFYTVGGLSSYFMQREIYEYYYTYRNSDSIRYRKEVFGENRHIMAILDLSMGYERKLGKHLSIQAEPYLKIPLKGVGEGKVNLYSAGFMLGLKFDP